MHNFIYKLLYSVVLCLLIQQSMLAQSTVAASRVDLKQQGSAPGNPAATYSTIYVNGSGVVRVRQSDGTDTALITALTAPVTSVFGRTGAVVAVSGDYTTTLVTEGTNLYFTNARARSALSAGTGVTYDSGTGAISIGQPVATSSSPTFVDLTLTSTNTSTTYADALETTITFNPSGATTSQHAGYYNNVSSAGSNNFNTPGGLYGIENYVTGAGTGSIFNMIGQITYVENTTHPTVTTVVGNDVSSFSDAGSTVNELAGIRVYTGFFGTSLASRTGILIAANTGVGTTIDGYGLKIEDQTNATNNYAIYTGSGNVRIGALTASQLVGTDASKNLVSISTSAGLASAVSDETGSGALVFANTPSLVTPVLGVATATSINKIALTAPATSATLTLADGSSLVTSGANSITLTSTGATSVTLPTSGTLVNDAVTTLSSLVSVGTITTGTWQGTDIAAGYLADTAVTPGSYTNASITVDQQGRLTAASSGSSTFAFSSLTAATATNDINNAAYQQDWRWNTLAGGTGLAISSTSTAATANTQKLFSLALSGANSTSTQTTYAAYFSNTHTGTSSTNIALYSSASGGTLNYDAQFPTRLLIGSVSTSQEASEIGLHIVTTSTSPTIRFERPAGSEYKIGVFSDNKLYITNNNGPTALGSSTNGLTLNSSGYFRIYNRLGIARDASYPLHVQGETRIVNSSGHGLQITDDGSFAYLSALSSTDTSRNLKILGESINFFSGTSYTSRMVLDSSARLVLASGTLLGIGMTPTKPLHVNGEARIVNSSGHGLQFIDDGSNSIISTLTVTDTSRNLLINGESIKLRTGTTYTDRVTINSSGNATFTGNLAGIQFSSTVNSFGNSGTSFTLNWSTGAVQQVTLTGNVTSITLSNPIAGTRYIIYFATGAGAFTVTGWPAAVKWASGVAPTITLTASKVDKIVLDYDGTSYYGEYQQNY